MTPEQQAAFDAMRNVLLVIQAAPRTHPERDGATYWQYNLIPRTIGRIDEALQMAEAVTEDRHHA